MSQQEPYQDIIAYIATINHAMQMEGNHDLIHRLYPAHESFG
jgi:hypothetical protein